MIVWAGLCSLVVGSAFISVFRDSQSRSLVAPKVLFGFGMFVPFWLMAVIGRWFDRSAEAFLIRFLKERLEAEEVTNSTTSL